MLLRARSERWSREIVEDVRRRGQAGRGQRAHVISWQADSDGQLLDADVAAVELINVLRPTVAIGHYVMFGALALHQHPEVPAEASGGRRRGPGAVRPRGAPILSALPVAGGRVRNAFSWRGHHFAEHTWVLLDLYGTKPRSRTWQEPETLRPERFRRWDGSPFNFIPQGGGDHHDGHRCPANGSRSS